MIEAEAKWERAGFRIDEEVRRQAEKEGEQYTARLVACDLAIHFLL